MHKRAQPPIHNSHTRTRTPRQQRTCFSATLCVLASAISNAVWPEASTTSMSTAPCSMMTSIISDARVTHAGTHTHTHIHTHTHTHIHTHTHTPDATMPCRPTAACKAVPPCWLTHSRAGNPSLSRRSTPRTSPESLLGAEGFEIRGSGWCCWGFRVWLPGFQLQALAPLAKHASNASAGVPPRRSNSTTAARFSAMRDALAF